MIGQMTFQQAAQFVLIVGLAGGVPMVAYGLWLRLRVRRHDQHLTHHRRF